MEPGTPTSSSGSSSSKWGTFLSISSTTSRPSSPANDEAPEKSRSKSPSFSFMPRPLHHRKVSPNRSTHNELLDHHSPSSSSLHLEITTSGVQDPMVDRLESQVDSKRRTAEDDNGSDAIRSVSCSDHEGSREYSTDSEEGRSKRRRVNGITRNLAPSSSASVTQDMTGENDASVRGMQTEGEIVSTKVEQLSKELESARSTISVLKETLQELSSEKDDGLQRMVVSRAQESEQAASTMEAMRRKDDELALLRQEVERKDTELTSLRCLDGIEDGKLGNAGDMAARICGSCPVLTRELASIKAEKEAILSTSRLVKEELDQASQELVDIKGKFKDLQEGRTIMLKALASAEDKADEAEQNLSTQTTLLRQAHGVELLDVKQKLETSRNRESQLLAESSELREQLAAQSEELRVAKGTVRAFEVETEETIRDLTARQAEEEQESRTAQQAIANLSAERDDLQHRLEIAKTTISTHADEIQHLRTDNGELREDRQTCLVTIADLESKLESAAKIKSSRDSPGQATSDSESDAQTQSQEMQVDTGRYDGGGSGKAEERVDDDSARYSEWAEDMQLIVDSDDEMEEAEQEEEIKETFNTDTGENKLGAPCSVTGSSSNVDLPGCVHEIRNHGLQLQISSLTSEIDRLSRSQQNMTSPTSIRSKENHEAEVQWYIDELKAKQTQSYALNQEVTQLNLDRQSLKSQVDRLTRDKQELVERAASLEETQLYTSTPSDEAKKQIEDALAKANQHKNAASTYRAQREEARDDVKSLTLKMKQHVCRTQTRQPVDMKRQESQDSALSKGTEDSSGEKQSRIDALTHDLYRQRTLVATLQAEVTRLESALASAPAVDVIDQLRWESEALARRSNVLIDSLNALTGKMEAYEIEIALANSKAEDYRTEVNQISLEKRLLEEQSGRAGNSSTTPLEVLEREKTMAENRLDASEVQVGKLRSEAAEARLKFATLTAQKVALGLERDRKAEEAKTVSDKNKEPIGLLSHAKQAIASHSASKPPALSDLEDPADKRRVLEKRILELERELEQADRRHKDGKRKEVTAGSEGEKSGAHRDLQEQHEKLKIEISALSIRHQTLKSDFEATSKSLQASKSINVAHQKEIGELEKKVAAKQALIGLLQSKDKPSGLVEQPKMSITAQAAALNANPAKLRAKQAEVDSLQADARVLQSNLDLANSKLETSTQNLESLNEKLRKMSKRLITLEKEAITGKELVEQSGAQVAEARAEAEQAEEARKVSKEREDHFRHTNALMQRDINHQQNLIKALEADAERLRLEMDAATQYKLERDDMEEGKKSFEARLTSLQSRLDEAGEALDTSEAKLEEARTDAHQKGDEIARLKEISEKAGSGGVNAALKIAHLQKKLESEKAVNMELQAEITTLQSSAAAVTAVDAEKVKLAERITSMTTQIENLTSRIRDYDTAANKVSEELSEAWAKVEEERKRADTLHEERRILLGERVKSRDETRTLNAKISTQQGSINVLTHDLSRQQSLVDALSRDLKEVQDKLSQTRMEAEVNDDNTVALLQQLAEARAASTTSDTALSSLKSDLERKQTLITELHSESTQSGLKLSTVIADAETKLNKSSAERDTLATRVKALDGQVEVQAKEVDTAKRRYSELLGKAQPLLASIDQYKSTIAEQKEEIARQGVTIGDLTRNYDHLTRYYDQVRKDYAQVKAALATVTAAKADLIARRDGFVSLLKAQQTALEASRNTVDTWRKESQSLVKRLETVQAALGQKDLSIKTLEQEREELRRARENAVSVITAGQTTSDALRAGLKTSQDTVRQLQAELISTRAAAACSEKSSAEIVTLINEVSGLKAQLQARNTENLQLEKAKTTALNQAKEAKRKFDIIAAEKENMRGQIVALQQTADVAVATSTNRYSELLAKSSELSSKQAIISSLSKELEEQRAKAETIIKEAEKVAQKVGRFLEERKRARAQIDGLNDEIAILKGRSLVQGGVEQLKRDKLAAEARADKAESGVEALKAEKLTWAVKHQKSEEGFASVISEKNKTIAGKDQNAPELRRAVQSLRVRLTTAEAKGDEARQEMGRLHRLLDMANKEAEIAKEATESANTKVDVANQQVDKVQNLLDLAYKKVGILKDEVKSLKDEVETAKKAAETAIEALELANTDHTALVSDLAKSRSDNASHILYSTQRQASIDKLLAEKSSLQDELAAKEDELIATEDGLAAIKADLAVRDAELAAIKAERDGLKTERETLSTQVAERQSRVDKFAAESNRLYAEVAAANISLEANRDAVINERDESTSEANRLRAEYATALTNIEAKRNTAIKERDEAVAKLESNMTQAASAMEERNETIAGMESSAASALKERTKVVAEVEIKLAQATSEKEQLLEDIKSAKSQILTLELESTKKQRLITTLASDIRRLQTELATAASYKTQLAMAIEGRDTMASQVNPLKGKIATLAKDLAEKHSDVMKLVGECTSIQAKLKVASGLETERNAARAERDNLVDKAKTLEQYVQSKETENAALAVQILQAKEQSAVQAEDISASNAQRKALEANMQQQSQLAQSQISALESEVERKQITIHTLTVETERLSADLSVSSNFGSQRDIAGSERDALAARITSLEEEEQSQRAEITKLTEGRSKLIAELERVDAATTARIEGFNALRSQLDQLQTDIQTAQTTISSQNDKLTTSEKAIREYESQAKLRKADDVVRERTKKQFETIMAQNEKLQTETSRQVQELEDSRTTVAAREAVIEAMKRELAELRSSIILANQLSENVIRTELSKSPSLPNNTSRSTQTANIIIQTDELNVEAIISDESGTLARRIEEQNGTIQELQKQIDDLRSEANDSQMTIYAETSNTSELEVEILRLSTYAEEVDENRKELEEEIAELRQRRCQTPELICEELFGRRATVGEEKEEDWRAVPEPQLAIAEVDVKKVAEDLARVVAEKDQILQVALDLDQENLKLRDNLIKLDAFLNNKFPDYAQSMTQNIQEEEDGGMQVDSA